MKRRQVLKLTALVVLVAVGIILYADLKSIHQIYRISDSMINSASDAQSRQILLDDRKRRDREEERHKLVIQSALAIDMLLSVWVAAGFLRQRRVAQP